MTTYMIQNDNDNDNESYGSTMNYSYSLDDLPCDILQQIADSFLNPAERSRLSTCNKRLNDLLPTPLRIKVVSSAAATASKESNGISMFQSLQPAFFVTPAPFEEDNNMSFAFCRDLDRYVSASDNLVYGQRYYLWTFDYLRGNKVYLGRHTRHGLKDHDTGMLQDRYSIGLRPRTPTQTWEVIGNAVEYGDVVMWGDDIGLSVGGNDPRPRLPDSSERKLLSCLPFQDSMTGSNFDNNNANNDNGVTTSQQSCWSVIQDHWGSNERLQLIPIDQFVPGPDIYEKELNIHAIPDACDEGEYLLHSPCSLQDGSVTCDGFHVIVNFDFWMEKGVMHFHAPVLPFTMGIPILETDYSMNSCCNSSKKNPISNLLDIKSARWGCLIYYMAVAADITEGKTLDMDRFLRRVTDHEDHAVLVNEQKDFVYIDVKGKKINQSLSRIAKHNGSRSSTGVRCPWSFVLSW